MFVPVETFTHVCYVLLLLQSSLIAVLLWSDVLSGLCAIDATVLLLYHVIVCCCDDSVAVYDVWLLWRAACRHAQLSNYDSVSICVPVLASVCLFLFLSVCVCVCVCVLVLQGVGLHYLGGLLICKTMF